MLSFRDSNIKVEIFRQNSISILHKPQAFKYEFESYCLICVLSITL